MDLIQPYIDYLFAVSFLPAQFHTSFVILIKLLIISSVAWIAFYISRNYLISIIHHIIYKTSFQWDDLLIDHKVFFKLSKIIPFLIIYANAHHLGPLSHWVVKFSYVAMILITLNVLNAILDATVYIYRNLNQSLKRPIKGYIQVLKLLSNLIAIILIIAVIINKDPSAILTGLGAMTAVLMLVFKDTILGLVASIQINSNHLVKIGDWVEMPKYGADGDVIDITLHTIKIQNWDKTITTIPTYAFITDSLKNWRGMNESGGRRIKRSVYIDLSSISFLSKSQLDNLKNIKFIEKYLNNTCEEIANYNEEHQVDPDIMPVNGRSLTNIGVFRYYLKQYLEHHPKTHKGMTMIVRHLAPTQHGLPIEIYTFSRDQAWENYENIQADIFDHIFAILPEFGLKAYQSPSSYDVQGLIQTKPHN